MINARSVECVVIGDGTVGKTSMLISFTQNRFPVEYVPTDFDRYAATMTVDGQTVALSMWDTAGQEDYSTIRPRYSYGNADVFVMCFSVISRLSYENVSSRWIKEVRRYSATKPIILVGTKLDLRENVDAIRELRKQNTTPISYQEGLALAANIKAVKYIECSAFTRQQLKQVFDEAVRATRAPKPSGSSKKKPKSKSCSLQ